MTSFTMTLNEVLEMNGGHTTEVDGRTIVHGADKLGLSHYPIFDESYRDILNGLIFDRYMNQEIAHETDSMFRLAMRRHMNEHMGYFNKLYLADKIEFDPLSTANMKTLITGTGTQVATTTGTSAGTSGTTTKSRTVQSDTPQTQLAGNADYATAVADASSEADVSNTATESGESDSTTENTQESTVTGYQGAASQLLMQYRESVLNVDMMLLDTLSPLFFPLWDVPNDFTNGHTYHDYTATIR